MKKQVAGRQRFQCNNRPGSSLQGLEIYNCPLWSQDSDVRGNFNESGYEIDHVTEWSLTKDDNIKNLQALCSMCHKVKTKHFMMTKRNTKPVKKESIKKESIKKEPIKKEPIKKESIKKEPIKKGPSSNISLKQEQAISRQKVYTVSNMVDDISSISGNELSMLKSFLGIGESLTVDTKILDFCKVIMGVKDPAPTYFIFPLYTRSNIFEILSSMNKCSTRAIYNYCSGSYGYELNGIKIIESIMKKRARNVLDR
jgi:hypothetical protein